MKRGLIAILVLLGIVFKSTLLLAAPQETSRFVTDNGIVVLVQEQHSLPLVAIQIRLRAGSVLDPPKKAGVANLTAELLEQGTSRRTASAFSEAVDFIGADFSARASKDDVSIAVRLLKKDIETGFDLFSDVLMHPKFNPAEFERKQKQVLGGIKAEQDQPGAIARRAFQALVFREHPYRNAVVGDAESVAQITRDDLVSFHKDYYHPNNTIIAIAGDITVAEVKKLLQQYLGGWQKKAIPVTNIATLSPLKTKEIQMIEKDLSQATVILGHLGIDRKNPDYYAVLVMNYILGGGGFSSRMMADIRDDQGLVYSIYSRFSNNALPGTFSVALQTKSSNTKKAIEAVVRHLKAIQEKPVSEVVLAEARDYIAGSFPLRMDSTSKIARLLAEIEFHQLGMDYFDAYPKAIQAVTSEDVLRVAKAYLDPEHYVLVVLGKQSDIQMAP